MAARQVSENDRIVGLKVQLNDAHVVRFEAGNLCSTNLHTSDLKNPAMPSSKRRSFRWLHIDGLRISAISNDLHARCTDKMTVDIQSGSVIPIEELHSGFGAFKIIVVVHFIISSLHCFAGLLVRYARIFVVSLQRVDEEDDLLCYGRASRGSTLASFHNWIFGLRGFGLRTERLRTYQRQGKDN